VLTRIYVVSATVCTTRPNPTQVYINFIFGFFGFWWFFFGYFRLLYYAM
jgi:hypothetical protein